MIQYSKEESLDNEINYSQEKHNDGNLIDAMHDPNIYIDRAVWVLFTKEITSYFT